MQQSTLGRASTDHTVDSSSAKGKRYSSSGPSVASQHRARTRTSEFITQNDPSSRHSRGPLTLPTQPDCINATTISRDHPVSCFNSVHLIQVNIIRNNDTAALKPSSPCVVLQQRGHYHLIQANIIRGHDIAAVHQFILCRASTVFTSSKSTSFKATIQQR